MNYYGLDFEIKSQTTEELLQKWDDFRGQNIRLSHYRSLMTETWPILYRLWEEKNAREAVKEVDENVMGDFEALCFASMIHFSMATNVSPEWCYLLLNDCETAYCFHKDLINAMGKNEGFSYKDGIIVIELSDRKWVVDTSSFDLPEDIPYYEKKEKTV